ncbi:hypothetical protein CKO12_04150 [Chromatium okenii]|uniref:flagellar hook-length control protein FliK n=1 Tax=Chromatium okenii TaxID=61644 RepID=UPI0019063C4F|nr:flagellar hook-length control protein FliK [Chromatium okenii]MBK1641083.1 hypothetical protein [Chromatium okenii]
MPEPLLPPVINARQLTALQAAAPTPAAKLSPAPALSPAPSATAAHTWLDGQLRQHLPRAQPLRTTLERWHTALAAAPNTQTRSTEHQLLATFITQLPTAKDLVTPQRLADTFQHSGLWLEAQLAETAASPSQPAPDFSQDLKAQLLCLAAELRAAASANPSPPPAEATEVAVAEIISSAILAEAAPVVEDASTADSETDADADCEVGDELDCDDEIDEGDDDDTELTVDADGDDDADAEDDGAATFADAEGDPNSNSAETAPQLPEIIEEDEITAATSAPPAASAAAASDRASTAQALLRDIDGVLGQMVTYQLLSLDAATGQAHWQLELPFRAPSGAIFTLTTELHQNPRRDPSGAESWTLRLQLDLPRLGPLVIQLSVRADRLDAALQAGTEAGAAVLQEHLATLRAQLLAQRLEVASLYAGYRPLSPATPLLPPHLALIRELG